MYRSKSDGLLASLLKKTRHYRFIESSCNLDVDIYLELRRVIG
jgi:hypothetical protein